MDTNSEAKVPPGGRAFVVTPVSCGYLPVKIELRAGIQSGLGE